VNERLSSYEAWSRLIDRLVVLRASARPRLALAVEAEEARGRAANPVSTLRPSRDYVRRFCLPMPSTQTRSERPLVSRSAARLTLGADRLPLSAHSVRIEEDSALADPPVRIATSGERRDLFGVTCSPDHLGAGRAATPAAMARASCSLEASTITYPV